MLNTASRSAWSLVTRSASRRGTRATVLVERRGLAAVHVVEPREHRQHAGLKVSAAISAIINSASAKSSSCVMLLPGPAGPLFSLRAADDIAANS